MRQARLLLLLCLPILGLALALPSAASAETLWLCKPGLPNDPCSPSLTTTKFTPTGQALGVSNVKRAKRPKFDCFYVYPTVSNSPGPNAPLRVDPELRSIAQYQAARYSRDCRVYAPVYRQIPLAGIGNPGGIPAAARELAYSDVLNAWRDYLANHNKGRGVVLIGHSQGTGVLRRLIREEVDPYRSERKRVISAILLGGNVLVKAGEDVGGDFQKLPGCRSRRQVGCVIAFVTFQGPVPANSRFGRTTEPDREVLCTNPTSLRGGSGIATPVFPTEPFAPGGIAVGISLLGVTLPQASTPWASIPRAYRTECSSADGADVLQIQGRNGAPTFKPSPDATWGLHLVDANIALQNLTNVVRRQARGWLARRHGGKHRGRKHHGDRGKHRGHDHGKHRGEGKRGGRQRGKH